MGWAFLPPLQRTLADPTLVSQPHDLPHMLPTWRDPSFASHQLTHVVSATAPSGVFDGDGSGRPQSRYEPTDLTLLMPMTRPAVQRAVATLSVPSMPTIPAPPRSLTRTSPESMPLLQLAALEPSELPGDTTTRTPEEISVSSEPEPVGPLTGDAQEPWGFPSASLSEAVGPAQDSATVPDRAIAGADAEPGLMTARNEPAPSSTSAVQRTAAPVSTQRYGLGAPLRSMPSHSVEPIAGSELESNKVSCEPTTQRGWENQGPTVTSARVSGSILSPRPGGDAVMPARATVQRHAGHDHAAGNVAPSEQGNVAIEVQTGVTPRPPSAPIPPAMPLAHDRREVSEDDSPVLADTSRGTTSSDATLVDETPVDSTPIELTAQRHPNQEYAAGNLAPNEPSTAPIEVETGVTPQPPPAPTPPAMPLAHDGSGASADDSPVLPDAARTTTPPEAAPLDETPVDRTPIDTTPIELAVTDPAPTQSKPPDEPNEPTVARSRDAGTAVEAPTLRGENVASLQERPRETSATAGSRAPTTPLKLARSIGGDVTATVPPDGPGSSTVPPVTRPLLGLQWSAPAAAVPTPAARTPVRAGGTAQRSLAGEVSSSITRTTTANGRGVVTAVPSPVAARSTVPKLAGAGVTERSAGTRAFPVAAAVDYATVQGRYEATGTSTGGLTTFSPAVSRAAESAHKADPAHMIRSPIAESRSPLEDLASTAPAVVRPTATVKSHTSRPTASTLIADLPLARASDGDNTARASADSPSAPALEETFEPTVPVTVSRAMQTMHAGATEVPIQNAESVQAPTTAPPHAPAGGGATGAASSPEDVEALAQKLMGPMMRRIRAEMLLDRERRGLRTDRRR